MNLDDLGETNFKRIFADSSPEQSKANFVMPGSDDDGSLKSRHGLPLVNQLGQTGITFNGKKQFKEDDDNSV